MVGLAGKVRVIDEAEIRQMGPAERARLARVLAAVDGLVPEPGPGGRFRRRLLIAVALASTFGLAAWIGVLAVTLPPHYRAGGWQITWIGFDVALLVTFALTAWSAWRRRQLLILCLVVLATLLFCDAWFDVTLDWETSGFTMSLLLALLVELPAAAAALVGARRLLRLTIGRMEILEGSRGPVPAFWRVPLFGDSPAGYRDLLRRPECVDGDAGPPPPGHGPEGANGRQGADGQQGGDGQHAGTARVPVARMAPPPPARRASAVPPPG
jgi:hypothetical protein